MTTPASPPEPPYDTPEPPYDTSDQSGREDDPRKRGARAILPILGVLALLAIKLGLVFPAHGSSEETGEQGYWHLYFPKGRATSMAIGAPVVADGHRIGSIVALVSQDSSVSIGFHIDTSYNSVVQSEPGFAVGPIGSRHLCFGTHTECGRGSPDPPVTQLDPPAEAPGQ